MAGGGYTGPSGAVRCGQRDAAISSSRRCCGLPRSGRSAPRWRGAGRRHHAPKVSRRKTRDIFECCRYSTRAVLGSSAGLPWHHDGHRGRAVLVPDEDTQSRAVAQMCHGEPDAGGITPDEIRRERQRNPREPLQSRDTQGRLRMVLMGVESLGGRRPPSLGAVCASHETTHGAAKRLGFLGAAAALVVARAVATAEDPAGSGLPSRA